MKHTSMVNFSRRARLPDRTSAVLALIWLLAACSPAASRGRISFVEPADGATVSSPVHVTMSAENFTVEPAGEVRAGAGHLHIIVGGECAAAGEAVPRDDTHLHYGNGQLQADLELAPGTYRLCLQAANGAHVALAGDGMTHTINITVK